MSAESIVAIIGGVLALMALLLLIKRKLPAKVKRSEYVSRWRDIQSLCRDKQHWPQAIIDADMLLDEVLKKKRMDGKSTGERLVSAQKIFTNNDAVWQAHKLANHVRHTELVRLKEQDVKEALVAFRQALRDLEAV